MSEKRGLDLRGLAEETIALREQVKDTMKEWAALDVDECPLDKIGTALVDLHAENKRLHHRRQIAEDGLDHAMVAENDLLKKKIEELHKQAKDLIESYEKELKEVHDSRMAHMKKHSESEEKLSNACEAHLENIRHVTSILHAILQRPEGFLKIYGVKPYEETRDCFHELAALDEQTEYSKLLLPEASKPE